MRVCALSAIFIVCAGGARADRLKIVASIYPVADLVRHVGGDRAEVRTLLPPGASTHTFDPSPAVVREFSNALLFFQVGAGLETWAAKLVMASGNRVRAVTLSEGMKLLADSAGHEAGPDGGGNPHVWLDPVLAREMVGTIARALEEADPEGAAAYRENARAYGDKLRELDEEIRRVVSGFRIRSFVSFHAAWTYFARRYGLVSAGVIEESPGREPTPRQLESIIAAIKKEGIRAVFAEPQLNPRPAEVIARQAGARVIILDPEGGAPGRETYIDLMRYNLGKMREAMQ